MSDLRKGGGNYDAMWLPHAESEPAALREQKAKHEKSTAFGLGTGRWPFRFLSPPKKDSESEKRVEHEK